MNTPVIVTCPQCKQNTLIHFPKLTLKKDKPIPIDDIAFIIEWENQQLIRYIKGKLNHCDDCMEGK